ncbi:hypothetical protein V5O48_006972 [Marasmius crinis-equi]|uniref:Transposase n=1 Tax=Marasmius crinis-equi TaxID=585013 RepID=A0ABR3FIG6_9AGAR
MHDNARHFLSSVEISQVNQTASEWNSFRDAIIEKFPELRKCDGDWPISVLFDGWVYHREVRARARERERNAKAGKASPKKTRRKARKVAGDGKAGRVGTAKAKKQQCTGKPPPPPLETRKRKILYVGKKPQHRSIGSAILGSRESGGMPEPVMGPPRLFRQESGQ